MNLKDIMSNDLIVGNVNDSIYDIANLMVKYDIGFIPIEQNKKIIGVITDRDIALRGISTNISPDDKIEKIITTNIIKIGCDKKIEDALDLMGKEKIKRLLISDNDKIIGVVSLSDIINSYSNNEDIIETLNTIFSTSHDLNSYIVEIDTFYL